MAFTRALSDYRTEARALLRDSGSTPMFADTDLNRWANQAKRERDLLVRVQRVRISRVMIVNQFTYTLADIVTSGTVLTGPAAPNLIDVSSIVYNLQTGGTTIVGNRVPLGRVAYSEISPLLATNYASAPIVFATYGATTSGTIFVAPPPAQAYPTEWDFFCYTPELAADSDVDALPWPYTDCVPFYMAAFAKQSIQRFDEAGELFKLAEMRLKRFAVGARPIAVRNPLQSRLLQGLR